MPVNQALPISNLVSVTVTLSPQAAQSQSLNSLLLLGTSAIIDTVTRIRSYTSVTQVANDFGSNAPETLAATLWFEQNPSPAQLFIGRWVKNASAGQLLGGALTAQQQLIANWNTIANGGFSIAIDGGAVQHVNGLNFTAAANMNGVAAVIQAALANATVVWDAIYNRFEITSHTTGVNSQISFVTAAVGVGVTDISAQLQLVAGTSGIIQANGLAAESALTAVQLFDSSFGQQWFGLVVLGAVDADHLAIAGFIEADNTKHYYGVTTQEAAVLTPGDTTDIAYLLQQQNYNFTGVQYSSSNPYAVVSMLARILTTDWDANNTTITLMYKQEPGIVAEQLNQTQMNALLSKNCNVFVQYNNNTAIIQPGVSSSGNFIDTAVGGAALAVDIQTAVYNLLFLSPTKIPQTDAGMHLINNTIAQVCQQYVQNGFLATGVWNSSGFGSLNQGDTVDGGFYIFAPSVNTQTAAQRASRISVPFQIAAKTAGAVHQANIAITINP